MIKGQNKASLIITRYKESNKMLFEALDSINKQEAIELEVLILDQFYNKDTESYSKELNKISLHNFKYIKIDPISLSYAKNYGIELSSNEIVLFAEPDMYLERNWAKRMRMRFVQDDSVCMMMSKISPLFEEKKTCWFAKASIITELFSVLDLWDGVFYVLKSLNWWLHKKRVKKLWINSFFNENLWRKNGVLLWGEETDLADRIKWNWGNILYNWKAIAKHRIFKERNNFKWLVKRLFYWGVSRYLRGGVPSPTWKKKNVYDYLFLPIILMFYFSGYLYGVINSRFK